MISLTSTGVTPLVRAAPSMTRYSRSAWQPMRAASWTMSRVRVSSPLCRSTSSKAKLSKTSISSGSVALRVETWPGNSWSCSLRAASLMAILLLLVRLRDEADGQAVGAGTGDGADDPCPVAVVLGVIGGVDVVLDPRASLAERDVAFDPASPYPA